MNRKQLILILLALVIIGGAGLVSLNRNRDTWSEPQGKMGQKLFPTLMANINDVASVHVKGADEVHLNHKDGMWRVEERGGYPANYTQISELLVKAAGLKIAQSEPIGPSQLTRMELQPAGKGAGSGTLLELKDAQGKVLYSALLGKKHVEESSRPSPFGGGEFPNGRYLMRSDDPQNVLLVSDPLSDVDAKAEPWLNRDFFKVEKPKSMVLVSTNATNSWNLSRETETAAWVLANTSAGEVLDSNKVSSLASTLSYPSFVDVATNSAPAQTGLDKPTTLTITTFDQFTYELKFGNKTPEGNYYMSVAINGDFPKERVAGKDEKPEDKAKLDKEFQAKIKGFQDRLAQEKTLGQWVYVVSSGIVEPLLRDRAQLMVEKKEEPKPEEKTATEPPTNALTPALTPALTTPIITPPTSNTPPATEPK